MVEWGEETAIGKRQIVKWLNSRMGKRTAIVKRETRIEERETEKSEPIIESSTTAALTKVSVNYTISLL